jgi:hypothetical protein
MKFKLILKIFRISNLLVRLFDKRFSNGLFSGTPGDLAEICIRDCYCRLISENDRLGVELHLSQEVY